MCFEYIKMCTVEYFALRFLWSAMQGYITRTIVYVLTFDAQNCIILKVVFIMCQIKLALQSSTKILYFYAVADK